jgi:multisubunit Na+/H+ antiporter MnhE subunit
LSAYSITFTPGELVAEFVEVEDTIMYVHCLDMALSKPKLEKAQEQRLQLLYLIFGYDK